MLPYKKAYNYWISDSVFDDKTKEELRLLTEEDIRERFYKNLEFGTAGLRGILGAGTNRINIYTVRKATQGFANYLIQEKEIDHMAGVAIAYDPRNMSREFAVETSLVFNANGIKTYVYDGIRPTPQLSFTVRELGCCAGVMITASHNPPEYNGYKVYGADGAQVSSPYDIKIINHVNIISDFTDINTMTLSEAKSKGLYTEIGKELDEKFLKRSKKLAINTQVIKKYSDIPIVYTPIHGAGNLPIKKLLENIGFTNVHIVKEQQEPNGNFPTVKYPNPEEFEVFEIAIKLAKEINAEVIIGSDPDADRVGVVCKNNYGDYVQLSGNMVGVLLTNYIMEQKKITNTLPNKPAIITSVVSSKMTFDIAKHYGASCFEVFTGFKYFGELIKKWEQGKEDSYDFVYGFEESYGYMAGNHVRDKDAVGITMLICEMVAHYKSLGLSIYEGLQQLYEMFGYYKEETVALTLKGIEGTEKIKNIMEFFYENQPNEIAGIKLIQYNNFKNSTSTNLVTNEVTPMDFPKSNVINFKLSNGAWICMRPSGTEPKIKFYFGVSESTLEGSLDMIKKVKNEVMKIVEEIM